MIANTHAGDGGVSGIRIGSSCSDDPADASSELGAGLLPGDGGLSIVFASSRFAPDALAGSLRAAFGDTPLIGCTTAGEIGPDGYHEGSLSGAHFAPGEIDFEIGLLEDLEHTDAAFAAPSHLMPVGNAAPPRPTKPDALNSAITSSGFIVNAFLSAA